MTARLKPVRCDLFTPPSDDEPAAVEQPTTDPSEGRPTVTASNSEQPTTTHAQLGVNNPKDWIHKMCKDVVSPDTLETAVSQGVHGSTSGTIVASTDKLWPDSSQTIYYCFLPGDHVGSNAQQDKVRNAIKEWSHYANVRFVEASVRPDATFALPLIQTMGVGRTSVWTLASSSLRMRR